MSVVSLSLAKEFIQIGHSRQDNAIQLMIDGAESFLANYLGVDFASASHVENLPLSPGPLDRVAYQNNLQFYTSGAEYLLPTHKPVTAVASVTDLQDSGTAYTFALIGNRVLWADEVGRTLGRWPMGAARWQVTYTGGYATLPAQIKEAICKLVHRAYRARGGETSENGGGASTAWGALMDSDILKMVKQFSQKPMIGF